MGGRMGDTWMDRWAGGRASLGRDGLRAEGAVAGRKGGRALRCRRTPTSGGRWFGFRDLPAPCVSPRVDSPSRPLRRPRGGWRRGSRGSADPRLRRPGTVPGAHLCPSLPSTRCSSRPRPPVGLCSRPPPPPAAPQAGVARPPARPSPPRPGSSSLASRFRFCRPNKSYSLHNANSFSSFINQTRESQLK